MLTHKQRDLLEYIYRYQQLERGVSPSFDEMKDHLRYKSKSAVHRLLGELVERKFIANKAYRTRAIEILKMPQDLGL